MLKTNLLTIDEIIKKKIEKIFVPFYLSIINESNLHRFNNNNNSHYKIILVTDYFNSMPLIERHKKIYISLSNEMTHIIHALSIQAYTINEWKSNKNKKIYSTSYCHKSIK
uniref:BolA family transcriptional regulator n=1 Tax=Candidatus Aschnera chinzeii TaxID=1485666 RepID=A0AAT9G428_9ENTR|nr:MAG: BolA family transcriptional regulator [Candidatus Aschnera chinzeii]